MPSLLPLEHDEVHLWYVFTDHVRDPKLLEGYPSILSDDERSRHRRFRFAQDRHRFLVAHALVRCVLSRYAAVAPPQWEFANGPYGKPEIETPSGLPPYRFNLSHTKGLIACAVSLEQDIGVDVENMERSADRMGIARRFFAPREVSALERREERLQSSLFFALWTLKEAYIKARGLGLAIPLKDFSFQLRDTSGSTISFAPATDDDASQWQFGLFRPSSRHTMALAINRGAGADVKFVLRQTIPLLPR